MEKQYGLIIPGAQKKNALKPASNVSKTSVFNESSTDSENEDFKGPQRKGKPTISLAASAMERKKARTLQEKALAEDPTVYQYDELYDDMETQREEAVVKKSAEPKQPKYIGKLLECAKRRKLEYELRVERQVQKEREQEGEEFQDKEKFVTTAYRKKLEEMRKLVELEKQDEYLESIGDVTKQKDLDGFYRHLYEQKTGTSKEILKPKFSTEVQNDEDIGYTSIKSGKSQKQRAYRKRRDSEEEPEAEVKSEEKTVESTVNSHLENNIDADSDFSIDSSSSDDENEKENDKITKEEMNESQNNLAQTDTKKIALNLQNLKKDEVVKEEVKEKSNDDANFKHPNEIKKVEKEPTIIEPAPIKKDKSEIWKKRTVGEVFNAALQRYYERKAARRA